MSKSAMLIRLNELSFAWFDMMTMNPIKQARKINHKKL